jgi:Glyoxalase-like domain
VRPMARGLDHIVHAVRDLESAADLYRRLGFTVGARNTHPRSWGTQNHVIQLPGVFIELLAVADTGAIAPHSRRHFSFGAFNRDFLAREQGLSMLVLSGRGAPDADQFRAGGIGDFERHDFEREGKRPDGTTVKVAFSLAFASDPQAPDIGFFTCQQHYPENFWNPAFQKHANSVEGVVGVVIAADRPEQHRPFFETFVGASAAAHGEGFAIATARGAIEVVTPVAFLRRFGVKPPDVSGGARLAAVRLAVTHGSRLQAAPELAGLAGLYVGNAAVVGPEDAMGAILVFEPATKKAR